MPQRRASALPVRDRGNALALAATLALVVVVRVLPLPTVYHAGAVVLSSNDPYYYRYWVEQSGGVAALPEAVAHGEPLLVVALRAVVAVLGPWSSGHVLAWYPVVSAVVTGLLVYVLAVRLSDDARVGLAAVAFLAVTPAHAGRTGLGFADHHAFDYPWLVLTALALVVLFQDAQRAPSARADGTWATLDGWPWGWVGVLAVGIAGQVLAWDNGALLVLPVGVAVSVVAPLAVRDERLLWRGLAPCVVGVGVAAGVVAFAHVAFGWHTAVVAFAPALLFAACVAVLAVTALAARLDLDGAVLAAVLLFGAGLAALVAVSAPDLVPGLDRGLARLFGDSAIGETRSLVAPGAVVGPLMVLGFAPLFALPAGAWALRRGSLERAPGWLVGATYLAYFLALALVQRRFVGELAPFAAAFAGVGFVAFLAWLGLAASPLPSHESVPRPSPAVSERADGGESLPTDDPVTRTPIDDAGSETQETVARGGAEPSQREDADDPVWFEREEPTITVTDRTRRAFVGGLGAVFLAPGALYAGFLYDQSNVSPHAHAAAQWMRAYADERGWAYPANRVFSHWGRVRMFNYFVNGESASYAFAQQHYDDFVASGDADYWGGFFSDRVGFVVTRDVPGEFSEWSLQRRLHDHLGSATGTAPAVASFRALYASADGSVKVFAPVRGATIVGRETGDGPVTARTTAAIASDAAQPYTFEYLARARQREDGSVAIRVGQPGTYAVSLGDESTDVVVSEQAVEDGATIEI